MRRPHALPATRSLQADSPAIERLSRHDDAGRPCRVFAGQADLAEDAAGLGRKEKFVMTQALKDQLPAQPRPQARAELLREIKAHCLNDHVCRWIEESVAVCQPDRLHWCNGSIDERKELFEQGVRDGTFIRLNPQKLPNSYLHRSNPNDVARSEHLTFICTPGEDLAGPTNNWMESKQAYAKLRTLFSGCMMGRAMYVVPFVMGPVGSALAKVGVQLTDSLYVAVSMGMMTRMGDVAWEQLGDGDEFTRCLHSVGDVNPERRYICHFPLDNTVWSFGSGYGGNALLGKKCLALRIASYLGKQQGWMA